MKYYRISKTELISLLKDSCQLENLKCAGVDNWSGYGESFDYLEEEGFESYDKQAESLLGLFKEI